MASYSKKYGKWQARITWRNEGTRHYKSKNGFATKKEAQIWAVAEEQRLNKGIAINKEISLSDYYQKWIKTYKKDKTARITYYRYTVTGQAVKDYFKQKSIKKINRLDYQKFINWYGEDHAPVTVKKANTAIRACVKSAILDDYIIKDFTQSVTLSGNKERVIKVDYLNLKEIRKLIDYLSKKEPSPRYMSRGMILLAIYSGMRLSEIQGLTWNDINFIKQTIDINKTWDQVTHEFKPTKNESSVRTIKVNQSMIKFLRKLKKTSKSNMVFMNTAGTIPTSNAVNKVLRHALETLSIKRDNFHFHSLRHSHVAILLAHGIDLYAISKRLGHSNTAVTSEVYAYLIEEYKDKTDDQIITALNDL